MSNCIFAVGLRQVILSLLISINCFCQLSDQKRIVIAHRGDHTDAPENTLQAFIDAIDQGLDYVEVDLRTTKDNQLVIMHDKTIDRMTNGGGSVSDLTWNEINQYQIIDKGKPQLGTHKIPLFSEVLDLCKDKIRIYLDFKDADASATWELIRSKKMEKSLVVYINHKDQYKDWRANAPQVPLVVSLPDSVTSVRSLKDFLKEVDAEILDGDCTNYTPEMVRLAMANNRQVWLDFQQLNEGSEQWKIGTNLGIQGFQSDKPRDLKAWFATLSKH